ncbi:MAG TPA: ROK family protein [Anaerolineales bacterium]|jgi:glucokinase|nr:ROK family protein [Anaerolineales bacterium]HQX01020.1 ROK family protein [Anaerolineales bacterium]
MRTIVSIDIGGTRLRAAAYKQDQFQPISQKRVETKAKEPNAFGRLINLLEDIWPKNENVDAIGVSSPGPVDPHTGVIMVTPNIKEWRDFPITAKLTDHFGIPAYLDNDANLAGLAEWKFGAGRGHHNVLYLTVSTGVGGGVIINDQLLQGHHGLAAELGHTTIQADGPLCGCGQPGHLESFSSGTGIERFVAEQLKAGRESLLQPDKKNSAHAISEAAKQGDALSIEAYQNAGKYLGIGVANFLHAFDPSIVIFGGGVSQSGPLLFDSFHVSLKERVIHSRYLEGLVITRAELGDDSGLLGARALAELKFQN